MDLTTTSDRLQEASLSDIWSGIRNSRSGGAVQRCHGIPHQGDYSNAKHQWGVAMLMWYLWPKDFPRLAIYCLSHDVPEAWVGDIPSPVMQYTPGLKAQLSVIEDRIFFWLRLPSEHALDPEDYAKLKACDKLELYIWCLEELERGNRFADECKRELDRYFKEVPLPGVASDLLHLMQNPLIKVLPAQAGIIKQLTKEVENDDE